MTVSVRLNEADAKFILQYADLNNMSVSDLFRQSVLERIEDEIDRAAYERAITEYRADPVTYSLDEVEKILGLSE